MLIPIKDEPGCFYDDATGKTIKITPERKVLLGNLIEAFKHVREAKGTGCACDRCRFLK
jgi:hypothetical protein